LLFSVTPFFGQRRAKLKVLKEASLSPGKRECDLQQTARSSPLGAPKEPQEWRLMNFRQAHLLDDGPPVLPVPEAHHPWMQDWRQQTIKMLFHPTGVDCCSAWSAGSTVAAAPPSFAELYMRPDWPRLSHWYDLTG
jgi:hypothetical protein